MQAWVNRSRRATPRGAADRELPISRPGLDEGWSFFYNTPAAGVIVVLNKRRPAAHKGTTVMLNASRGFRKGRPKNYLPEEDIRQIADRYHARRPVDGELTVITLDRAKEAGPQPESLPLGTAEQRHGRTIRRRVAYGLEEARQASTDDQRHGVHPC